MIPFRNYPYQEWSFSGTILIRNDPFQEVSVSGTILFRNYPFQELSFSGTILFRTILARNCHLYLKELDIKNSFISWKDNALIPNIYFSGARSVICQMKGLSLHQNTVAKKCNLFAKKRISKHTTIGPAWSSAIHTCATLATSILELLQHLLRHTHLHQILVVLLVPFNLRLIVLFQHSTCFALRSLQHKSQSTFMISTLAAFFILSVVSHL